MHDFFGHIDFPVMIAYEDSSLYWFHDPCFASQSTPLYYHIQVSCKEVFSEREDLNMPKRRAKTFRVDEAHIDRHIAGRYRMFFCVGGVYRELG